MDMTTLLPHPPRMSGKAHRDVEAALGPGFRCECSAVDADDSADDGQAEPVPASLAEPLGAEPLERLEEAVHLIGRDQRSGVADSYDCQPVGDGGGDLDPASF